MIARSRKQNPNSFKNFILGEFTEEKKTSFGPASSVVSPKITALKT